MIRLDRARALASCPSWPWDVVSPRHQRLRRRLRPPRRDDRARGGGRQRRRRSLAPLEGLRHSDHSPRTGTTPPMDVRGPGAAVDLRHLCERPTTIRATPKCFASRSTATISGRFEHRIRATMGKAGMCSWPTPPGPRCFAPEHTRHGGIDRWRRLHRDRHDHPAGPAPNRLSARLDCPSFALSKCVDRIDSRGAPGGQEPGCERNGNERK